MSRVVGLAAGITVVGLLLGFVWCTYAYVAERERIQQEDLHRAVLRCIEEHEAEYCRAALYETERRCVGSP